MPLFLSILSALFGIVASLFMLVLLLASAPNSKPDEWASIKGSLITISVVGLAGVIGAIWLMIVREPMAASAVGAAPGVFCILSFIIMLKFQQ